MATNRTVGDVIARAQSLLNDENGTLWTATRLLPHVKNAYAWLFTQIARWTEVPTKTVSGPLTYAANTEDLTSILPADLWLPLKLEFRKDTGEEWQTLDRRDSLPSRETTNMDRVIEWEWRFRTIFVNKGTAGGLLRIHYESLLPDLIDSTSALLMDNALEALAYYAAADAYQRRGQDQQAARMLGAVEPPTGARGTLDAITTILVKNEQLVARRGKPFSGGQGGYFF